MSYSYLLQEFKFLPYREENCQSYIFHLFHNDNKECIEKTPRFCYLAKILNKIIVLVEKVIFFPSEGCSSCYYCWYLKHFCVFGS